MALSDHHFIFIHGYTSSSKGDWYPQMAAKLNNHGISYSIPDMPGGDRPRASEWLKLIHKEVSRATKPVVLVGQSLGTRAVMLYLHENPAVHVRAVFLIATFNNDVKANRYKRGEGYANFFEFPVDTNQLRDQADNWVILHAYDDENIPYSQSQDIAAQLQAKLILSRGQAHFNHPDHADYVFAKMKKYLKHPSRMAALMRRITRRKT